MTVPQSRLHPLVDAPVRPGGGYVLYWMTASRRLEFNFALQHAVDQCSALSRPLVILEALRCDYPHASDRLQVYHGYKAEFAPAHPGVLCVAA